MWWSVHCQSGRFSNPSHVTTSGTSLFVHLHLVQGWESLQSDAAAQDEISEQWSGQVGEDLPDDLQWHVAEEQVAAQQGEA